MVVVGPQLASLACEVDVAAMPSPSASRCCGAPAAARRSSPGRGCLMYAVVLSYDLRPGTALAGAAHRFVLETTDRRSATCWRQTSMRRGTSDLAIGEISNSRATACAASAMRFLYHGTLLYDFDCRLIEELLPMPPRQPDYRQGRAHRAFVTNLPADRARHCATSLVDAWQAEERRVDWPRERVVQGIGIRAAMTRRRRVDAVSARSDS